MKLASKIPLKQLLESYEHCLFFAQGSWHIGSLKWREWDARLVGQIKISIRPSADWANPVNGRGVEAFITIDIDDVTHVEHLPANPN